MRLFGNITPLSGLLAVLLLSILLPGCSLEKKGMPGALDPYWDVIWAGDIYLADDHVIGSENTLVIRPGTRVHFTRSSSRVSLIVYGGFEILGERDNPVEFLSDNGLTNEIYVYSYPQYENNGFSWTDLGDNKLATKVDLTLEGCRVARMEARLAARVILRNSVVGLLDCGNFSSLDAEYVSFDRSSFPSLSSGDLNLVFGGLSSAVVHRCNFYGGSGRPLSPVPVVEDYTSTNLDLSGNYWRTNSSSYIGSTLVFNDTFGSFLTTLPSSYAFPVR